MTTKSPATSNSTDLVLQLVGGDRNGHLLPVSTAKCLLSSLIVDKVEAEKYRCAIFRGDKGVAFRSYSELVLVNGNKTSVQWLKEGDTIQLTPEMQVVVKHLGTFAPTKLPNTPVADSRQAESPQSVAPTPAQVAPTSIDAVNEALANLESANTPASETNQVKPAADQNVGQRVNVLSDQLSSLVTAASNSGVAAAGVTSEPAAEATADKPLSDSKMADASSSIQDYLDKALASPSTNSIASPTPAVAPAQPADVVAETPEPRKIEATLEIPAVGKDSPDSSAESASKVREEAVTSSLNRLLAGTENAPAGQDPIAQSSAITAQDQLSAQAKPDSALQPNPTLPITSDASEVLASDAVAPIAPPVAPAPVATPTAAIESFKATAPVEAPKAQSTEFLESLGIDAKELGLSDAPRPSENTVPTLPQPVLDAPRAETPSDALPTADEIIASVSTAADLPAEETPAVEATAVETPAEPVAEPVKAESVADVLARMQNAGSLDSFSMDGPAEVASSEPVVSTPAKVATPEPQVSETVVVEATESTSTGDDDGSVENYMSQLLTRMRGGEDSSVPEEKESDDEKSAPVKEVTQEAAVVEAPVKKLPQETLTAEQFVPKEKAVRMKSFDSLREIANNSNRSAIQDHLANQRKIATQTKMQLSLISLAFGVLFFLMSWVFSSEVSIGGVICGIVFLFTGVIFAKFCRDEQQLDESINMAQKAKR